MRRKPSFLEATLATALMAVMIGGAVYLKIKSPAATPEAVAQPAPELTLEQRYPHTFPAGSTLFAVLTEMNVSGETIYQMVQAAKPHRDLSRITPGTRFRLTYREQPASADSAAAEALSTPEVTGITIRFRPQESLLIENRNGLWVAEPILKEVETRITTFSGQVTSSLWESAVEAQMDPHLIAELAEIFAWQMDFSREVRMNDRWRLSVEQEFIQNEAVGWGSILAAEYINGDEVHAAFLFRKNGEDLGYFGPDGGSLRRMFLKAPIQYGRISSRFTNRRFHPVLKRNRPHLGVDYAAPTGTPIRAVGDGVVTMSGWNGGAGNMLKIRHNGTYETAYKHLSRFAKGIRRGARVKQGQTIGYVGSTGLSTGPHLHFEFFVNGRYVDPLRQKFPSADPVPPHQLAQFMASRESLIGTLPAWGVEIASDQSEN